MKALQCELCGGTDIIKDGDFFVCQSCGMKYTLETAKKMMVEGIVQVKGEVSIQNDTAINNNLELAQSSLMAANFEKAEKYADEVIALDQKNADAWFVKAKSALGQTSIGNDRVFEMMVMSKSVVDIVKDKVRADPPAASSHELELLGEVSDLVVQGVVGLCKLYGNAFAPLSNSDIGGMIVNSLPTTLETATHTLELIKACFQGSRDLERFTKIFQNDGIDEGEAQALWQKLNSDVIRIGEIRFRCAEAINQAVVKAYREESSRYEKDHIFKYYYYGGERPDTSAENTYLTNHQTTLKNYITLTTSAIDLYADESVFRYVDSSLKIESWTSELDCYYDNISAYISDLKTHKTEARYITQYSSGTQLHDSYTPTDSFIAKLDEQLALSNASKIANELKGTLWEQKLTQEKQEQAEAWWSKHDALKERLDAFRNNAYDELTSTQSELKYIKEQIDRTEQANKSEHPIEEEAKRLEGAIGDLNEQINRLGFFKRKERTILEKEKLEKQDALTQAKLQLEKELEEERNRIHEAISPLSEQMKGQEARIAELQRTISSVHELLSQIPDQGIINQLTNGDLATFFYWWKSS